MQFTDKMDKLDQVRKQMTAVSISANIGDLYESLKPWPVYFSEVALLRCLSNL